MPVHGPPCDICPAGTYNADTGASNSSACIDCVAGKYSAAAAATNLSTCLTCAAGHYTGVNASINREGWHTALVSAVDAGTFAYGSATWESDELLDMSNGNKKTTAYSEVLVERVRITMNGQSRERAAGRQL